MSANIYPAQTYHRMQHHLGGTAQQVPSRARPPFSNANTAALNQQYQQMHIGGGRDSPPVPALPEKHRPQQQYQQHAHQQLQHQAVAQAQAGAQAQGQQQGQPASPPLPRQNSKTTPPSPPRVITDKNGRLSFVRVGFLGEVSPLNFKP